LDQVQFLHQVLDQLLARALLPLHEALDQAVLLQQPGDMPQAVLDVCPAIFGFSHGHRAPRSAGGDARMNPAMKAPRRAERTSTGRGEDVSKAISGSLTVEQRDHALNRGNPGAK